ncbi:MAG: Ig-like domain-containing protein [Burkholderiaceae bacterium]
MTPAVTIRSPSGAEETLPLADSVLSLDAIAGASYRIVDTENPAQTFEAIMRRVGDDLLIDLLDTNGDVLLVDYFFICELDYRGCAIELDSLGGPVGETLTPANQGATELSDGSILLWTTPPSTVGVTPPATSTAQTEAAQVSDQTINDSDDSSLPIWAIGGGAAGVALLASLAGGGSSDSDSAVDSDGVDRSGSGTLADRSVTLTRIESNEPVPVDEDGQELTDPSVDLSVGEIAQGGQTNDASPELAGTLDAVLASGQAVVVFRGGQEVGRATVDGLQWSFTDSGVPAGEQTYAVRIADGDGNQSPLSAPYSIFVDGNPPAPPVVNAVTGDNEISEAEAAAGVAVSGTAEAGARVTGQWGDSTVTTEAADDGRFVLQFDSSDLPGQGVQVLEVTAIDSFGNTSDTAEQAVLMPGNSIDIVGVIDNVGSVTGLLGDGSITNDTFPTLIGTLARPLAPGEQLQVWRNGGEVATGVGDGVIADGTNWSFTDGRLLDGIYSNSARIVDSNGSVVDISDDTFTFIIARNATGTPAIQTVGANSDNETSTATISSADVLETGDIASGPADSNSAETLAPVASNAAADGTLGQWLNNNLDQYQS